MTTLILGGRGFLGGQLARALLSRGEVVLTLSRTPMESLDARHEHHVASIDDANVVRTLLPRVDFVFHAAADTTPGSSSHLPVAELESNLLPLARLLECLQQAGEATLVYVSSGGAIYDPASAVSPFKENAPKRALSYYAAGKLAAERFIEAHCEQSGQSAVILRPSNVFGPGQVAKAQFGVVPTVCDALHNDKTFSLYGDGSAVRDFLYIEDFTALCLAIVGRRSNRDALQVLNVGSGRGVSIRQLCEMLEAVSGRQLRYDLLAPRGVDVKAAVVDTGAALALYGWSATTEIEQGLQNTWRWYKGASR